VADSANDLCPSGSFTIAALIWPTLPGRGREAIISAGTMEKGCSVFLDDNAMLSAELTADGCKSVAASGIACRERSWYVVVATYDASASG
jgi:N,N-dimethylformamidase